MKVYDVKNATTYNSTQTYSPIYLFNMTTQWNKNKLTYTTPPGIKRGSLWLSNHQPTSSFY